MVTFFLIHFLFDFFLRQREVGLDIESAASKAADKSDGDGPLTQPNTNDSNDSNDSNDNTGSSWYSSKKFWGCVIVMIAGLAGFAYYLKGFSPISPDDMASFNAAVSEGIQNVSSEQASLGHSVSGMVNSAAFRADQLNVSTEGILRDIVSAGAAARLQLEQTHYVTHDLNQLYSRVSYLDDRSTNIIRGIVYLISLRWVLLGNNSADRVIGSEVVNEVLSLERPFSFSEIIEPTATISTQTDNMVFDPFSEVTTTSTQTDDMDLGRIYQLIIPSIAMYGVSRVLWRLRSVLPVIDASMDVSDSDTTQYSSESSIPPQGSPDLEMTRQSPSPESSNPLLRRSLDLEMTPQSLEINMTPQSSALASDFTPASASEMTPQSVDHILVCDNPTFQPSTPTSIDETNPYQVHRHNFFRLRVGRHLPCFLQLLDRLGI